MRINSGRGKSPSGQSETSIGPARGPVLLTALGDDQTVAVTVWLHSGWEITGTINGQDHTDSGRSETGPHLDSVAAQRCEACEA